MEIKEIVRIQDETRLENQGADLDISVLIATCNRGEMLRKTLENMSNIDRDGLKVEFVVIDNNSTDNTSEVIKSFEERLPIRHLFESRPGKNCALNKALKDVTLGRVVAFTDDDVKPRNDWLNVIYETSKSTDDFSIFGGVVENVFLEKPPRWLTEIAEEENSILRPYRQFMVYHGEFDADWPENRFPAGANFWVKKDVFRNARSFDERFGPRPKDRIMGSESSFAKKLCENGHKILYCPRAHVQHFVRGEDLSFATIRSKLYMGGKTGPHLWGLRPKELYEKAYIAWLLLRTAGLVKNLLLYGLGCADFKKTRRIKMKLRAISGIAYGLESMKISLLGQKSGQMGMS
jgi:glucosyl-dolichyl phosphate glucuronosyltransferase